MVIRWHLGYAPIVHPPAAAVALGWIRELRAGLAPFSAACGAGCNKVTIRIARKLAMRNFWAPTMSGLTSRYSFNQSMSAFIVRSASSAR